MTSPAHIRDVRSLLKALMLACALAFVVNGCAVFAPPRPFVSEAEALAAKGEPTRRWQDADGTTTLEYATQPYGDSCLMVQVGADGVVLRQWDALDSRNLANVHKGMSMEEVSRMLGEHRSEQFFKLSGETVWDWNVYNDGPGIATLFNVHFVDGKVARTSRTYIYPNDRGTFGPWGAYPFGYSYGYPYGYYGYPYRYSRDYRASRRIPHPPFPPLLLR